MSGKNVRAENATIRPFRNIGAATIALDPVRLTIDGDEEKAGPVVVAPETLLWGKFTLTLPDLEDVQARVAETMLHVPTAASLSSRPDAPTVARPASSTWST